MKLEQLCAIDSTSCSILGWYVWQQFVRFKQCRGVFSEVMPKAFKSTIVTSLVGTPYYSSKSLVVSWFVVSYWSPVGFFL